MRLIRIYQPGPLEVGHTLNLTPSAAQHVSIVLRLKAGTRIILFCGDNYEYASLITDIHKKQVQVKIESKTVINRESPRAIHLAQSLAKGDKMEWIIQKAVELGVTSITPIITERSVVRLDDQRLEKKQHQWQAIAIAACEQSGRNKLPILYPACPLEHFLVTSTARYKWILNPRAEQTWPKLEDNQAELAVLIGPEGGFSEPECQLAEQYQVQGIGLGPRILRTETAAITTIGILQMLYGDF